MKQTVISSKPLLIISRTIIIPIIITKMLYFGRCILIMFIYVVHITYDKYSSNPSSYVFKNTHLKF